MPRHIKAHPRLVPKRKIRKTDRQKITLVVPRADYYCITAHDYCYWQTQTKALHPVKYPRIIGSWRGRLGVGGWAWEPPSAGRTRRARSGGGAARRTPTAPRALAGGHGACRMPTAPRAVQSRPQPPSGIWQRSRWRAGRARPPRRPRCGRGPHSEPRTVINTTRAALTMQRWAASGFHWRGRRTKSLFMRLIRSFSRRLAADASKRAVTAGGSAMR